MIRLMTLMTERIGGGRQEEGIKWNFLSRIYSSIQQHSVTLENQALTTHAKENLVMRFLYKNIQLNKFSMANRECDTLLKMFVV